MIMFRSFIASSSAKRYKAWSMLCLDVYKSKGLLPRSSPSMLHTNKHVRYRMLTTVEASSKQSFMAMETSRDGDEEDDNLLDGVITRFGRRNNMVAQWQAKGSHYISYENLVYLNDMLASYTTDRSKTQKKDLLEDLTLTYFARFHNIIREEYQFEKKLIQDRLKTWSTRRLQKEGYALMELSPMNRGFLFQDKVFRFMKGSKADLGYHKFTSGDIVRISQGDPMSISAIDGIVLERRSKYIDICVPKSAIIRSEETYRLDVFVNRVVYERMLKALQLFLDRHSLEDDETPPLSRCLRDLLIYSYPNSMMMLARSPGGLRMALPDLGKRVDLDSEEEELVRSRLEQRVSHNIIYPNVLAESSPTRSSAASQTSSSMFPKFTRAKDAAIKANVSFDLPYPSSSGSVALMGGQVITVADALKNFRMSPQDLVDGFVHLKDTIETSRTVASKLPSSAEAMKTQHADLPVFTSNHRLKQMLEKLSSSLIPGCRALTKEDVTLAYRRISMSNNQNTSLNPSQHHALERALLRPLTLIQGPPGKPAVL
jgi:hypothetical protein